ncbi:hypothetical protein BGLT_03001 [Caballeronia glathei]|nr:hypothetical protein BGLT_03001 [Caballeronia glathei]
MFKTLPMLALRGITLVDQPVTAQNLCNGGRCGHICVAEVSQASLDLAPTPAVLTTQFEHQRNGLIR